ncbi:EamA family transporter [Nocardioides stalactiti]|uniref:EamA family transporter n=1 Tax=Nocardioides stalactiti TaxID=2755356 RepID=UPI0028A6693F|nr:EamA family transporter [Nocardioides stalactiti]
MTPTLSSVTDNRIPTRGAAIGLVLIGIASVQFGAGAAKNLFDEVSPTGLVWLRLASSALVLVVLARPRWRGRDRVDWLIVLGFGLSLGLMNWAFYQSFSRIPIGIAVTIEFIGPLAVAVAGSRRPRDLAWVGLAGLGVALLGAERADLDLVGVLFALLAGACWAAYILLSAHTGRRWEGLDGLAVASLIAVVVLTPALAATDRGPLGDTRILALGAAIGLLCSVIPYSCELVALRRLTPAMFGVLMSLEPAAAAFAGLLVVGEELALVQWLAITCVVLASIGATRAHAPVDATPPPAAG